MLEITGVCNDINVDDRFEVLTTILGYFLLVTFVNKIEFDKGILL